MPEAGPRCRSHVLLSCVALAVPLASEPQLRLQHRNPHRQLSKRYTVATYTVLCPDGLRCPARASIFGCLTMPGCVRVPPRRIRITRRPIRITLRAHTRHSEAHTHLPKPTLRPSRAHSAAVRCAKSNMQSHGFPHYNARVVRMKASPRFCSIPTNRQTSL